MEEKYYSTRFDNMFGIMVKMVALRPVCCEFDFHTGQLFYTNNCPVSTFFLSLAVNFVITFVVCFYISFWYYTKALYLCLRSYYLLLRTNGISLRLVFFAEAKDNQFQMTSKSNVNALGKSIRRE